LYFIPTAARTKGRRRRRGKRIDSRAEGFFLCSEFRSLYLLENFRAGLI